jgi:hypothetical protein
MPNFPHVNLNKAENFAKAKDQRNDTRNHRRVTEARRPAAKPDALALGVVEARSGSGVGAAQMSFSGALVLRTGGQRVADMDDGHVDEIQQRSIRASFPKGASLFQFLGDFEPTIDLRHGVVLLS